MNLFRLFTMAVSAALFLTAVPMSAQEAVGERPAASPDEIATEAQPAAETASSPAEKAVKKAKAKAESSSSEEKPAARGIEGMTPEQFKAAGLDKLSPEELKNLDASLKGYKRKVETTVAKKANEEAQQKAQEQIKAERRKGFDRIESRVDGTLNRVTGHSIITLEDGTRWKQVNPEDNYRAQVVDHPSAVVTKTAFGYKIRISGLPDMYVDPVRP